jgi:predicted XRE-type DNA-binding protein
MLHGLEKAIWLIGLACSSIVIRIDIKLQAMTTEKLQITVGSDNVFRDLGFPEGEAQNMMLRCEMVIHIRKAIDKLGITQAEAAKLAGITQPRMNDLIKNRNHKFTIDALVNVAANLGYTVQVKFKKLA